MSEYKCSKQTKQAILTAALDLAKVGSYTTLSRESIANVVGCAPAAISYQFGTMQQLRRAIMGEAIRVRDLTVIAQGLSAKDKRAMGCSNELKRAAVDTLCE